MSLSMTVMQLMESDIPITTKIRTMQERFGCPGKKFPCMTSYASGKAICEGCWTNFFATQVELTSELQKDEGSDSYESKDNKSI